MSKTHARQGTCTVARSLLARVAALAVTAIAAAISGTAEANPLGGCPASGSCYVAHGTPGCDDATCCNTVCALDPFCCNNQWDGICSDEAATNCASCGNPNSGTCYAAHGPFCADEACCDSVCSADPFCCNTQWDGVCVDEAFVQCAGCGTETAGSCYVSHTTPACADQSCCTDVCNADVFCCDNHWDSICANEATTMCVVCGNPNTGSCFSSHANPLCDDEGCCSYVCSVDAFCCSSAWDTICANEATDLCVPECGGPAEQSCYAPGSAACDNPECCNYVCGIDSFCCNVAWDAICVDEALANCVLQCGSPLAGPCNASHSAPYCSDETCCSAVCAVDGFCCSTMWDSICANESTTLCSLCSACVGDLDSSGAVGPADLATLLGAWGTNNACADISGNGSVGPEDLASLLGAWGICP